ncbi:MAG: SPOR domain-containing protein, partial [Flavobacteriales bacterium]
MKRLLLILLCVPLIGFGQSSSKKGAWSYSDMKTCILEGIEEIENDSVLMEGLGTNIKDFVDCICDTLEDQYDSYYEVKSLKENPPSKEEAELMMIHCFHRYLYWYHQIEEPLEIEEPLVYNKHLFDGNFIIVLNTFEELELAKDESQYLTKKGYNCEFFQLSSVSNSKRDVYQTFIGGGIDDPIYSKEEANQLAKALKLSLSNHN